MHYDLFARCHIDLYRGDGPAAARRFEARLPAVQRTRILRLVRPRIEHQRGQAIAAQADRAVAERHLEATGMVMHAAVAGGRHGELRAFGVTDPERVAACLAPGFSAMLQR